MPVFLLVLCAGAAADETERPAAVRQPAAVTLSLPSLSVLEQELGLLFERLPSLGSLETIAKAIKAPWGFAQDDNLLTQALDRETAMRIYIDLEPLGEHARAAAEDLAPPALVPSRKSGEAPGDSPVSKNALSDYWLLRGLPGFVLAARPGDTEKTELAIRTCCRALGFDVGKIETEYLSSRGISIQWFGRDIGYCVTPTQLFVFNDKPLLSEVLTLQEAEKAPDRSSGLADIRPGEITIRVHMDAVVNLVGNLHRVISYANGLNERSSIKQANLLAGMAQVYQGDDPVVITCGVSAQGIRISAQADLAKHPHWAKSLADVAPSRLAGLMPGQMPFFAVCRLTKEDKDSAATWFDLLSESSLSALGRTVQAALDDELIMGVTEEGNKLGICVMASIHGEKEIRELLDTGAPVVPDSKGDGGEDVFRWAPNPETPVYLVFHEGRMLAASDKAFLKHWAGGQGQQQEMGLFAGLDPPCDPGTRLQDFIRVRPSVLPRMPELFPGADWVSDGTLSGVADFVKGFREIRLTRTVQGQRYEVCLAGYFE